MMMIGHRNDCDCQCATQGQAAATCSALHALQLATVPVGVDSWWHVTARRVTGMCVAQHWQWQELRHMQRITILSTRSR